MTSVPEDSDDDEGLEEFGDPEEADVGDGFGTSHIEGVGKFSVETISFDVLTCKRTDRAHGREDFLCHVV